MADNLTFWVRFVDQSEAQAEKVYVLRSGDVSDLRTAVLSKFPRTLREPTDIASIKISDTELTNNRQSLDTLPQGTVVVTVQTHGQKRKFEDEVVEKLNKLEQDVIELKTSKKSRTEPRKPPSPPKSDDLSDSTEGSQEQVEYVLTSMQVVVEGAFKVLSILVDCGSPKSFVIPACAVLSPVKELDKLLRTPFGTAVSVGWVEGVINGQAVGFKCYGLAPDSVFERMGYNLLLGAKALKHNHMVINFKNNQITFEEENTTDSPSTSTATTTTTTTTTSPTASTTPTTTITTQQDKDQ